MAQGRRTERALQSRVGHSGVVSMAVLGIAAVILVGAIGNQKATVSGVVIDEQGVPVAAAIVRQQTKATSTTTAEDGAFTLTGLPEGEDIVVTAWHEGYYPAGVEVVPPADNVQIVLLLHPAEDNPDYAWYTSMPDPDVPVGCGHCMVAFPQWGENAHGQSAVNPRSCPL